jgi:hypothetical protein
MIIHAFEALLSVLIVDLSVPFQSHPELKISEIFLKFGGHQIQKLLSVVWNLQ